MLAICPPLSGQDTFLRFPTFLPFLFVDITAISFASGFH